MAISDLQDDYLPYFHLPTRDREQQVCWDLYYWYKASIFCFPPSNQIWICGAVSQFLSCLNWTQCKKLRCKIQGMAPGIVSPPGKSCSRAQSADQSQYNSLWPIMGHDVPIHRSPRHIAKHVMQSRDSHSKQSKITFCTYAYSLAFKDKGHTISH